MSIGLRVHALCRANDPHLNLCRVLRDHIRKLSKVITPEHAKLSIPQEYLVEAPWFFAQQQILQISAYKTAQEKVRCVTRCIMSIVNLLSMSSGRTPSADDLTPVLIFVLIKVSSGSWLGFGLLMFPML